MRPRRAPYAAERIMGWAMPQALRAGMVPPHLRRYAYGASPPPPERPAGTPAPSGERPMPDSGNGTMSSPSATGTLNPFYVGLAVTIGVFAAMVIFE